MPNSDYEVIEEIKDGNLEAVLTKKPREHDEPVFSFCLFRRTARGDRTAWHHKNAIDKLKQMLDKVKEKLPG